MKFYVDLGVVSTAMICYKAFQLTLKTLYYEIAMWLVESIKKVWG